MLGGMMTNIVDAMRDGINTEGLQMMERFRGAIEMQLLDVDDVADLALYVCSAESAKFINGAIIAGDNGWTGMTG
jgi:NAD(P)-dependent dehydrogenase (short-subunit alcohol dehydrogenase family)